MERKTEYVGRSIDTPRFSIGLTHLVVIGQDEGYVVRWVGEYLAEYGYGTFELWYVDVRECLLFVVDADFSGWGWWWRGGAMVRVVVVGGGWYSF